MPDKSYEHFQTEPIGFREQLQKELERLEKLRLDARKSEASADSVKAAHRMRLVGLAFSGGGIRSATFNLGVIQELARLGLLRHIDYLSTVSGGGYIGGWLSNLIFRERGPDAVEKILDNRGPAAAEPREVAWLRNYSNYLTPRTGLLSTDTLQGMATYVRNVILNQTALVAFLSLLLLLPWVVAMDWRGRFASRDIALPFLLAGVISIWIGNLLLGYRSALVVCANPARPGSRCAPDAIAVLYMLGGLSLAGALPAFWRVAGAEGDKILLLWSVGVYASSWMIGWAAFWASRQLLPGRRRGGTALYWRAQIQIVLWAFVGGAALGIFLRAYLWLVERLAPATANWAEVAALHVTVLGAPAVSLAVLMGLAVHLGLAGRSLPESLREWWGRLGGLLVLCNVAWLALAASAIYGPYGLRLMHAWAAAGGLVWLGTAVAGALAGASPKTGKKEEASPWLELFVRVAPVIFVVGLLVGISYGVYSVGDRFLTSGSRVTAQSSANRNAVTSSGEKANKQPVYELELKAPGSSGFAGLPSWPSGTIYQVKPDQGFNFSAYAGEFHEIFKSPSLRRAMICITLALAAIVFLFGWRIDINFFSLHMFYRNRLDRCYLGAARKRRRPDNFTDLDPQDSPLLSELAQRPFPIINATLNITRSSNLAWQERKAASFTFTPLYCGFEVRERQGRRTKGYRSTSEYGKAIPSRRNGPGALTKQNNTPEEDIRLAMPMTISGAAVSPNRGFHTSAATAFLMTMFNVRLGWWLPNPIFENAWRTLGPRFGLMRLLLELMGFSKSDSRFVYLSDGGNFENLGIYELVRRRCRYIVVCDVGCDPDFQFEDIGNAIRKIRIDLNIAIDIDVRPLAPDPATGRSLFHCAVGKIHYARADGEKDNPAPPGYLLYIKPTLNGVEPGDVLQYAAANKTFPHETTNDQWFSESQFEAYRKLGQHIAHTVLKTDWEGAEKDRIKPGGAKIDQAKADGAGKRQTTPEKADDDQADPSDVRERIERLFNRLEERWYAPSPSVRGAFSKQGDAVNRLFKRLYEDENLHFLDAQFYPQWPYLMSAAAAVRPSGTTTTPKAPEALSALPDDPAKIRASFYFCNELFQLMENIYVDLNFESEADHPDNRGWMNLFHNWSWSPMFRVAWSISAACYGARFQTFCERRLGMTIGRAVLGRSKDTVADTIKAGKPEIFDGKPIAGMAASSKLINPVEWDIIKRLQESKELGCDLDPALVVPLRLEIDDPLKSESNGAGAVMFGYPFAFALVLPGEKPELKFYRVQDHLQRIGLGGEGLRVLRREWPKLLLRPLPDKELKRLVPGANPDRLRELWKTVCAD